jgi:tetratricopeptide (TPR) repeat protein
VVAGEDAARHARLVLPVAVWLAFVCDPRGPRLGTTRWRSYAQYAVAADAQRCGRFDDAMRGYERALEYDCHNVGALMNLGSALLRRDRLVTAPAARAEHLERAGRLLGEAVRLTSDDTQAIWYRARYLRAIGLLHESVAARQTQPKLAGNLARQARGFAEKVHKAIHQHQYCCQPLDEFFQAFHAPLEVFHASAAIASGLAGSAVARVLKIEGRPWTSAATKYNLACYHIRLADGVGDGTGLDWLAASEQRRTEDAKVVARAYARSDPSFDRIEKEQRVLEITRPLTAAV